jgi:small-conductance mechanosensitive channel
MAAFDQLEIKFELFNYAMLIAFSAVALGFGLSFGLGGREVVSGILAGYYLRQRIQAGDNVQIADLEGTVRDVGPVATIVETQENGLMHRHSVPNTRMLNEAIR